MRYHKALGAKEILAALTLPGPDEVAGWTSLALSAVCPSVPEPHRASQILYDLKKIGYTKMYGSGRNSRHVLRPDVSLSDLPESLRPDRETIQTISDNIDRAKGNRFVGPKTETLRRWIYEVWADNPNVPYTKREILKRIRLRHPECPEHPISQQLYCLVQENRLRKCDIPGSEFSFVPVRSVDLFDMAESAAHSGASKFARNQIPVSFGEAPLEKEGWSRVKAFVKRSGTDHRIEEIRIVSF